MPARTDGLWAATAPLGEFTLQVAQRYQEVEATLTRGDRARVIQGRMAGAVLRTQTTRHGSLELTQEGAQLRITGGEGALEMARGTTFQRARAASCD